MAIVKNINLINFRSFNSLNLSFDEKVNIFFGKNGSGKTNILEAISLIAKGRGIRNSKFSEMVKDDNSMPWGVNFNILSNGKNYEVSSGLRDNQKGRDIKINSNHIEYNLIWLIL